MRALFVALALGGLGCTGKAKPTPTLSSASVASAAVPAPVDPADGGNEALCAPVAAEKIAPFEVDMSAIKAAVPPIVDPAAAMTPFYDRLLALARGRRADHLRIGVYGDSNLTSDHLTGHLRRALQARFGDGGHGFVGLARPWGWYIHEDVRHSGTWPLWKQIASTTDPVAGHRYGFANIAAESSRGGAAAWVGTAAPGSTVGRTASRFEVYYLKQPHGGAFDLLLDGKTLRTVSTTFAEPGPGYEVVETDDAAHELKCVLKGDATVRLFGATLERPTTPPGIVVDALGIGAMNFQRFMMGEPTLRRAHLEHRRYDLVVVWLGMNVMWLEPNRAWARDMIAAIHEALPDAPVLLLTPPDSVKMGESKTDPRILGIVEQLREVAAESHAAFWDFRAAMGGDAAYLAFMKRGLAANDRAHLSKQGNEVMGQRLLAALFDGVDARLRAAGDAGCAP